MNRDFSMIAETIRHLLDTEETTVSQIVLVCNVSKSTVYQWRDGDYQPRERDIRALITRHPSVVVREAILDDLTNATAAFTGVSSDDLDVNGDGKVDPDDLLDTAISVTENATQSLRKCREIHRNHGLDGVAMSAMLLTFNKLAKEAAIGKRQCKVLHKPRKKCRPLRLAK